MNRYKNSDKVDFIQTTLDGLFPIVKPSLSYSNSYTLLVATVLSAQCKDDRVNEVTKILFKAAETPQQMAEMSINEIEAIIKPCGIFRQKAKNIHNLSKIILNKFNNEVPATFEELETLPGVGHKTASVVLGHAFGIPTFPVDTHILRLTQKWFFNTKINVNTAEQALKTLFSTKNWFKLHMQMIFFGRQYCNRYKCIPSNKCQICRCLEQ